MSSNKKKLPPKVAAFITEAKTVLQDYTAQVKRADDAEAKIVTAAASADAVATAVTKLAEETADTLLAAGVIAADHRAKFAADLVDPASAHNLIRNLGKRIIASEAAAEAPAMGGPAAHTQVKSAGGELNAYDQFASRLRQASGV